MSALTIQNERLVTQSETATFKRCRRKWWLAYYRALRLERESLAGARALGNRIHDVLQAYYDPEDFSVEDAHTALEAWDFETAHLTGLIPAEHVEELHDVRADADLGRAMLEGYFEWLAATGADSDLEFIETERAVRVPLEGYASVYFGGRHVIVLGKLDASVLVKSTRVRRFLDHKTVGSLGDVVQKADIDEQFQHYSLLDLLDHRLRGEDAWTDGGIWNQLRKVKRTARSKPPYYGRHEVRYPLDRLRSYQTRLFGTVHAMEEVEARLDAGESHLSAAYPTPTNDCKWDCDFRAVCPMFDDPREDAEGFLTQAYVQVDPMERYHRDAGLPILTATKTED